ncbi:MAG: hypothetical protein AAGF25_02675 [Pseudomonadota bacterium]
MKTLALTFAATLIASTAALAGGGLFDVNDAPINHGAVTYQSLDTESTAAVDGGAEYYPFENTDLFDVNDQ